MGLEVGIANVPVGDGCGVKDTAPWVDIALSVSAAEVYSALSVAAGWGVDATNELHARITLSPNARKIIFLKFEIRIIVSV